MFSIIGLLKKLDLPTEAERLHDPVCHPHYTTSNASPNQLASCTQYGQGARIAM
jgi:hypothetical protein